MSDPEQHVSVGDLREGGMEIGGVGLGLMDKSRVRPAGMNEPLGVNVVGFRLRVPTGLGEGEEVTPGAGWPMELGQSTDPGALPRQTVRSGP